LVITPARCVCLSSQVRLGCLSLALIEEANGPAKVAKGVAPLDGGYTFATKKTSDQKTEAMGLPKRKECREDARKAVRGSVRNQPAEAFGF